MRATLLLAVLLGCLGCDLLPTNPATGRCGKDGDCPHGFTCATDRNDPATYLRCVCSGDACATSDAAPPADASTPDAAGTCGRNEDCPMAKPVCAAGMCVECAENAQCKDPGKGFCAGNACVGCAAAGPSACTGARPVCDAIGGKCVECAENAQCRDVTRPFCLAGVCAGCGAAGAPACATRVAGLNVCGPTGACVECTDAAAHCKMAGKAFCVANACAGCQAAGAGACKAPTAVCDSPSGKCVECVADATCASPMRPFCLANACAGCDKADPKACGMKDPAAPVCAPDGRCVECNASADCTADAARPICLANKCVRCSSDGECVAKLGANPGVCMAHQDGRCARDEDAIYVQNTAGCGTTGGLSATAPLCSPRDAVSALATRRLIVVRGAVGGFALTLGAVPMQVSIIGQGDAVFAGGPDPGFRLSGATDVYMRGVTVRNSEGIGVIAEAGATLRLERVTVSGNQKGGILLDGVAFDIKNTSVSGNGPGQLGLASWGGILVNAPGGTARLERVSIKDNRATGLTCSGAIQGMGVLASGNAAVDIATTCAITPCTPAGPACGAQF